MCELRRRFEKRIKKDSKCDLLAVCELGGEREKKEGIQKLLPVTTEQKDGKSTMKGISRVTLALLKISIASVTPQLPPTHMDLSVSHLGHAHRITRFFALWSE